jgi:sugar O-acyltransferase (sialic acid O-acetyltransferase NeuD family)
MRKVTLFGVRSPLVVDYEETCKRLGIEIAAGISVHGSPRMMDRSVIVDMDKLAASSERYPYITCAFSSTRRKELSELALVHGLEPAEALVDPTAILPSSIRVGRGTFINAGAIIGGACFIGEHVLINRAVSIGHHCVLGDFVSMGPGATLASNVNVGEGAVIGVGAVVVPNVHIGKDAVVGAGSLIRKDVGDGVFVAGNPAVEKVLDRNKSALNTQGEE